MSQEVVVRQLLAATRALRAAEDELRPDTEYLREEIRELLVGMETLFEKLHLDHLLREAQEVLHGREPEEERVRDEEPAASG